ncbi:MAG: FtsX-like permease family protein [Micropruina sp.]|uniref:FtsX-like permease family protein n=1 Tax=Micropruina sp. TaxID=2737536 RepID=UPI0039E57C17
MLRQVLRELRFHPSRFVATVIAIAISVAFMAGSSILVATESNGVQRLQSLPFAGADVVVELGPDAERAAVAKAVPGAAGVAVAEPSLTFVESLRHGETTQLTNLIGLPSEPLRWSEVTSGRWPQTATEVALSGAVARTLGVGIGDTLVASYQDVNLTVVGLTGEPNSLFLQTGYLAPGAFARFGVDPRLAAENWIAKAAAGTTPDELAASLNATALAKLKDVKAKSAAQVRAESMNELTDSFDAFRNLLWAFAAIAAVVGMITIANTFTILLAQRRRQIGLLRAVGASGAQVRRRFLLEALALGLVGAALGLLLGAGLAAIGSALTGSLYWGLILPASEVSIAFAVGVLITLVAAFVPVLRGTRVRPLEALQPEPAADEKRRAGIVRGVVCGLLLAGGVASGLLGLGTGLAFAIAIVGSALAALGVLFGAPLFVPALLRGVGAVVGRLGVTARLAAQNAVRNPRRASTTATALMLAVGLIVTLQVATASVRTSLLNQIDQRRPVDVAVSTWNVERSLPADLIDQLLRIPGVGGGVSMAATTAEYQRGSDNYGELPVIGYDPAAAHIARAGAPASIADDEVYVTDGSSAKPGERATLKGRSGKTLQLRVVPSPLLEGGEVMVSRATLDALGGVRPDALLWLSVPHLSDGVSVASAVGEKVSSEQFQVTGSVIDAAAMESVLNLLLAITTALLGVAVLIALIGVSNTLGLSVLERTRESALIRALGLQARSLRLMLLIEALLLAVVGVAVGVGAGIYFGWLGATSLAGQLKADVRLVVDLPLTLGMVAIAILAAALASILPGRRAAKASPTEALADI